MSNRPHTPTPLTIGDFSGGMTDYHVGQDDLTLFEKGDNLYINEDKDLLSRPGSKVFSTTSPKLPTDAPVNNIFELNQEIFLNSNGYIYRPTFSRGYDEIEPKVFPSQNEQSSFVRFGDQVIAASGEYNDLSKIYGRDDGTGTQIVKVETLGLPDPRLLSAYDRYVELVTLHNEHISTNHSSTDSDNLQALDEPRTIDELSAYIQDLAEKFNSHVGDANLDTPVYHAATALTDESLFYADAPLTLEECIELMGTYRGKLKAHVDDSTAHTVGTPPSVPLSLSYVPTITGGSGANSYLYSIHYRYRYEVNDSIFLERSAVRQFRVEGLTEPDFTISNVPSIENGINTNYSTSAIEVVIGRTTANGDVLYQVRTAPNGATTFTDSTSDDDLINNEPIYIEGGVLDDDAPPKAKYINLVNDVLVMGNVKEEGVVRKNRVRFSKRFSPYSCPESFFQDFQSDVTGVGRRNTFPIIFEKNRCHRLEGLYTPTGQGGYTKREISNRFGCISHASIVNIQEGVLFAGSDGFYFTNGYTAFRISRQIKKTFKSLVDKENIQGTYDKERNLVIWSCKNNEDQEQNNILYVAHLNFKKGNDEGGSDVSFTTWSDGLYEGDNFSCNTIKYIDDTLYRGTKEGYLLVHDDNLSTDVVLNRDLPEDDLTDKAIRYNYLSLSHDFMQADRRKWVPKMVVNANNRTPLSLDISSSNDNSRVYSHLRPILNDSALVWGDESLVWGDETLRWNYTPTISTWVRFPASGGLRCQYKQIRFTNYFLPIESSETKGLATVDATLKTVTLEDYPTSNWFSDITEYFISFETDNYQKSYRIVSQNDDVLTVIDDEGDLVDGVNASWRVNGYRKGELFSLIDYTLLYSVITTTQNTYQGGDS